MADGARLALGAERHMQIEVQRPGLVRYGEAEIGECLVRDEGKVLRAIGDPKRFDRVSRGQRHCTSQAATHIEVVHDEPPATRRRLVEALEGESLRLLLLGTRARRIYGRRDEESGKPESPASARTPHEPSRREC